MAAVSPTQPSWRQASTHTIGDVPQSWILEHHVIDLPNMTRLSVWLVNHRMGQPVDPFYSVQLQVGSAIVESTHSSASDGLMAAHHKAYMLLDRHVASLAAACAVVRGKDK